MKKIKTGIVGYGASGRSIHRPLIKAHSDFELTAISSSRPADVRADEVDIAVVDFPELLERCDLIVIATPHFLHFEQAKAALLAGKHVLVEKPFVQNLAQADELYDLAKKQNRVLGVFQNRRFDADFLIIQKAIALGTLGDIVSVESHFDRYKPGPSRAAWKDTGAKQAGQFWDLAPHLVDQAFTLFGKPENIFVDKGRTREGDGADDFFSITLAYPKGKRVHLRASSLARDFNFRWRVHGTKGSLLLSSEDTQEAQLKQGLDPNSDGFGDYPQSYIKLSEGLEIESEKGRYLALYDSLSASILRDRPFIIAREQVAALMAFLDQHHA
jgi:predicted dehydrogenase